ncbi:hypothetical protein AVEN_184624-1 [Araneus ventricosus]|uniref:Uncharacterized protein n=1 Tax=Araneus ventricosus TaxID=182803 RepID=A0A4Y2E7S9_ARAVE|nr:hypothetical protein AVEN_184624-1 [Araneus ventricosus]
MVRKRKRTEVIIAQPTALYCLIDDITKRADQICMQLQLEMQPDAGMMPQSFWRNVVSSGVILLVPPHNADTTGIWCTVRHTALRTPLSSCDNFVIPFCAKKLDNCF